MIIFQIKAIYLCLGWAYGVFGAVVVGIEVVVGIGVVAFVVV